MSFAAPGMLLGLLALALPLWLHRLRTDSARSEPFSSVRLLTAATQRVYVDRRIRYWLLLGLRLALLALLVLMFARPRLTNDGVVDTGEHQHWILVDLSASMSQASVQGSLKSVVESALESIPADQPVGLLSIEGAIEQRVALGQPRSAIVAALSDLSPGNGRLEFGDLLNAAGDYFHRSARSSVVHLVSDFQASAMPAQFSRVVPRAPYVLRLHPITGNADNPRIASAQMDGDTLEVFTENAPPNATLIVNVSDQPQRSVPLANGSGPTRIELELLPQENPLKISIENEDDLAVDDTYHLLVNRSPKQQILALTASDGAVNPFLTSALSAVSKQVELKNEWISGFDPRQLSRHRWLVTDDLGALSVEVSDALENWVRAGGRVLAGVGEFAESLPRIPLTGHRLIDRDVDGGLLGTPASVRPVSGVAVGHPLLDQRLAFEDIQVKQMLPLEPLDGDQLLLWTEDDRPLLLEHSLGQGMVLIINGGFDRRFNNWPTQASFVPFVGAAVDYLSGYQALSAQRLAGEALVLPENDAVTFELLAPNAVGALFGTKVTSAGIRLAQTGFYSLHGSDGTVTQIAVNIDPRESDLRTLDESTFERWENALARRETLSPDDPLGGERQTVSEPPADAPNPLAIWLLAALLALTLAESVAGNRAMRSVT